MLDFNGDNGATDGVFIEASCSCRIEHLDSVPGGCAFVVFNEAFAAVLGFESHAAPELVSADPAVSKRDTLVFGHQISLPAVDHVRLSIERQLKTNTIASQPFDSATRVVDQDSNEMRIRFAQACACHIFRKVFSGVRVKINHLRGSIVAVVDDREEI